MAYYNPYIYPQGYQQTYQQNMVGTQMSAANQDERLWVQGEGAAQAYLVAPNSFVRLWDSQKNVFYEKRADQNGRPYMETFEYSKRGSSQPAQSASMPSVDNSYVERIEALESRIAALEKEAKHDE